MSDVLIIAEAGVNHNGSLDRALEMVDVAAAAGADVIKFQTFTADKIATKDAQLAEYQKTNVPGVSTQWELLKGLELTHDEFAAVRARCDERGIEFLSTGFDLDELAFLIDELGISRVKVASGDLTFAPMLFRAGLSGLPVIVSTGMADLDEIGPALHLVAAGIAVEAGLLPADTVPDAATAAAAWSRPEVLELVRQRVTVLHCTSEYPAPAHTLNLRAMNSIGETYGVPVGYSDHSLGGVASTLAVGLGATVIEKHFTLDKTLPGPDHSASLDVDELHRLVADLRLVGTMLGSDVKAIQPEEVTTRAAVRRSIVAVHDIAAGAVITEADVECRRPNSGRTAFDYYEVVGTVAERDYATGDHVG
ncbi:MAG: N-acetylneuraminate synthase family protein [Pseudolysinimonas sp.]